MPAEQEIAGNPDPMHGRLVVQLAEARRVVLWKIPRQAFRRFVAAHEEFAGGNADELHAERIFEALRCCGAASQKDE